MPYGSWGSERVKSSDSPNSPESDGAISGRQQTDGEYSSEVADVHQADETSLVSDMHQLRGVDAR